MARRLPLRARLALLTALAVAVAVAAAAVSCWFLTSNQLRHQLDQTLADQTIPRSATESCAQNPRTGSLTTLPPQRPDGGELGEMYRPFLFTVQFVAPDGTSCAPPSPMTPLLKVTTADRQVAEGTKDSVFHDGTADDGTRMRVRTSHVGPNLAFSVARPLSETQDALRSLAILLTVVGAIGVVGAASAGLLVARAALRPVDRLTEAVEHVARTEDLDTVIPAEGKDEIARLSSSFNAMTASLRASRERQQQLIADAGHELRTPLTSLRTNTDLLLRSEELGRDLPPQDKQRLLRSVRAQLRELTGLVGDLLELARPDAGRGHGPPGVAALHEAVAGAVERARPRGAGMRISTDVQPWYVRGEAADLERAVVNLLDNAIKFGPDGGTVEVRLHDGELTVRDHGPGVAVQDAPHVFERFWRSTSARSLPGSGLGLAIVARTVAAGGGTVELVPAPGGGTLARVRLPGAASPP